MGDWPSRPSEADRERINKALDDLLTYACDELAPGWDITIMATGGEDADGDPGNGDCSLELTDPDGNPVSHDWEGDRRNIWDMVDHSRNPNGDSS